MTHAIGILRMEHRNMAKLLCLMENELRDLGEGQAPNYRLLSDIADYLSGYPDQCHHPKEDLILRKLSRRNPAVAEGLNELAQEHSELARLTEQFSGLLRESQVNPEAPLEVFMSAMQKLVDYYESHMEMEELRFFPQALRTLSEDDWAEVNFSVSEQDDPLFDEATERFRELRNKIFHLAEEQEEQRASHALFDNEAKQLDQLTTIGQFNQMMVKRGSNARLVRSADGNYRLEDGERMILQIPAGSEIRATWCAYYFLKGRDR